MTTDKQRLQLVRWWGLAAAIALLALVLALMGSQAVTAESGPAPGSSLHRGSIDQSPTVNSGYTVDLTTRNVWGMVNAGDVVTVSRTSGGAAYGACEADGVGFFWTPLHSSAGPPGVPVDILGDDVLTFYKNGTPDTSAWVITITGEIDVLADLVTGTLEGTTLAPGLVVTVTLGEFGGMIMDAPQVTDTIDGFGNFEADFGAAGIDIGAHEMAQVQVREPGGNTILAYVYPTDVFRVYNWNSVGGYDELYSTPVVTVYSSYPGTVRWSAEGWATWPHGIYNVQEDEVQYGDVVNVKLSDGTILSTTAWSMEIRPDESTDEVYGDAPDGSAVRGYVWDSALQVYVLVTDTAEAGGAYTLPMGIDLTTMHDLYVAYADASGNEVGYMTSPPQLRARIQHDRLYAVAAQPHTPVTYTLDHGGSIMSTAGQGYGCGPSNGCDFWNPGGLQAGDIFTAEMPGVTMVMTVADLSANFDTANDEITGTASIAGDLIVGSWQFQDQEYPINGSLWTTATASSPYVAAFTDFDIRDGMGGAYIRHYADSTGHRTDMLPIFGNWPWALETSHFQVEPPGEVWGIPPSDGEVVTAWLYAENGTTLLISTTDDYDDDSWSYRLGFGDYQIEPGRWVTMTSQSGWTAGLQVPTLTIDADYDTGMVWGEGPKARIFSGRETDWYWNGRWVPVDGYALNWNRWGGLDPEARLFTIYQAPNGNRVRVDYYPEILQMQVNYGHDWIQGTTLPDTGIVITVTLEGSDTVTGTGTSNGNGEFSTGGWLGGWDWHTEDGHQPNLSPGDVVTASVGSLTGTVSPIGEILGTLDFDGDKISGSINASWFATVTVRCEIWVEGGPPGRDAGVVTGDGGAYECDWSQGDETWDLQPGDTVTVWYTEPDGDDVGTVLEAPWMRVNYADGHDWVGGTYPAGHTFWITVTDSGDSAKGYAELDSEPGGGWGGDGFETRDEDWLGGNRPDIGPGDFVHFRADDGYNNTMEIGIISGTVDLGNDSISGPITATHLTPLTDTLEVRCEIWGVDGGPDGKDSTAGTDGDPPYSCSWSSEHDIDRGYQIGVQYIEPDDQDRVINVFEDPVPEMQVNKWTEGGGEIAEDGPAVFVISYQNHGNATADPVIITDTLDSSDYVTDTSGFEAHVSTGVVTWNVGPVEPDGQEHRFFVVLTHTVGVSNNLENKVDIWTPYDRDEGNNHAETEIHVTGEGAPDLYVNKHPDPSDPYAGDAMLWQIDYGNEGPVASGPVLLTDTLPTSTTVLTWFSENEYSLWTDVSLPGKFVLEAPSIPGYWGDRIYLWLEISPTVQSGTQLTNTVEITTAGDSDSGNNWHLRNDVWTADYERYDAHIQKQFGNGSLVPGGTVRYNIHLRNSGNRTIQVEVTDIMPDGASYVSSEANVHGASRRDLPPDSQNSGLLVWNSSIGDLLPGQILNIDLEIELDGVSADTDITNCVEIEIQGQDDEYPGNNQSCVTDRVWEHGPNIRVYKYYEWHGNDRLRYDIYIENLGSTEIDSFVFTDTYPAGTTLDDWYMGHGPEFEQKAHNAGSRELVLEMMDDQSLNPGDSTRIEMYINLDSSDNGQTFGNLVEGPLDGDVNPEDNTFQIDAYTGPDVFVEKWLSGGELRPGETVTFTVAFGNQNQCPWDGDDQVGSHITDTLPAGMTFITATGHWDPGQPWHPEFESGNTVAWGWDTMWCDSRWEFDLVVEIDAALQGGDMLTNTVEAYGDNPNDAEPNYDNNIYELPLTLTGPGYDLSKSYQSTKAAGAVVTYSLTVDNVGGGDGHAVALKDKVPTGVTYGDGDGTQASGEITWTFAKIAAGAQASGWFWGTLSCTPGQVTNDSYKITSSAEGITTGDGDPVSLTVVAPTLAPSFDQSATALELGGTVYFTNTSTTNGGDIVAWGWDYGDGATGAGATASHAYSALGSFDVTLTVTDSCGYSDSATSQVAVGISQTRVYLPVVLRNH